MRTFVYFLENVSRPPPEAIARHVVHLRALDDSGALVVCGPFADGDGGMVCLTAEDENAARTMAANDPFVAEGFKTFRLRELTRASRENDYLLR
jgi:uncharacterized protein YciI